MGDSNEPLDCDRLRGKRVRTLVVTLLRLEPVAGKPSVFEAQAA